MRKIYAVALFLFLSGVPSGLAQATEITDAAPFIVTFSALSPAPAVNDVGSWGGSIQFFADGPGTVQLTLFSSASFLQNLPLLVGPLATFDVGSAGTGFAAPSITPPPDGVMTIMVGGPGSLDLASASLNFISHQPDTFNLLSTQTVTFPTTRIASVPEPAGFWPLAVGLLGLAAVLARWRLRT